MLVYLTINLAVFHRASRAVPCEHQFLLAVPCRARLGFRRLLPTLNKIMKILDKICKILRELGDYKLN